MTSEEKNGSRKPRLVLAVTGSVAAIKLPLLVPALLEFCEVKIVCTAAAKNFFTVKDLPLECLPILGINLTLYAFN